MAEHIVVGFNRVPGARREVAPALARDLVRRLGRATPVGVFLDAQVETILADADTIGLRAVQLHGTVPPGAVDRLHAAGLRVLRALAVRHADDLRTLDALTDPYDAYVLDGATPGGGRPFDHALLAGCRVPAPWLLAGGLDPENVGAALALTGAPGADVASGVERDGRPDPERIRAFARAVRAPGGLTR